MCLTSLNRFVNKNKDSVIVPEELLVKSTSIVHLSVYVRVICIAYIIILLLVSLKRSVMIGQ